MQQAGHAFIVTRAQTPGKTAKSSETTDMEVRFHVQDMVPGYHSSFSHILKEQGSLIREGELFNFSSVAKGIKMFVISFMLGTGRINSQRFRLAERLNDSGLQFVIMTNSWFTSRRFANAGVRKLNCIFGCEDCVDHLSHYL